MTHHEFIAACNRVRPMMHGANFMPLHMVAEVSGASADEVVKAARFAIERRVCEPVEYSINPARIEAEGFIGWTDKWNRAICAVRPAGKVNG